MFNGMIVSLEVAAFYGIDEQVQRHQHSRENVYSVDPGRDEIAGCGETVCDREDAVCSEEDYLCPQEGPDSEFYVWNLSERPALNVGLFVYRESFLAIAVEGYDS